MFAQHILKQLSLQSNFRAIFKGHELKNMDLTVKEAGIVSRSIVYIEEEVEESMKMKIEVGIYYEG